MQVLSLPPSITVGPTSVDVTVLTEDGATVVVNMPLSRGLHELPEPVVEGRARRFAWRAMIDAAQQLKE